MMILIIWLTLLNRLCELEFDRLKEYTLAHTAVGEYLDRVSWAEIASHYFVEEEEEDVEEDNDSDYYTTVVD